MAANSSIQLTSLDFDSYKQSLKQYLKAQTQFKDYDFENSNMSVLLDLLSYNTYQNAFYLNMISNEMFLDSAQLRDSVVSHAKELNYLPRSFTSASAKVDIKITSSDTTKKSILIPKGTQVISRVGDSSYTFTTNENIVTTSNVTSATTNEFFAEDVVVYEGNYLTDTYVVDYNQQLIYKINNAQVDISSITVRSLEDNGSNTVIYTRATSMFGIDELSKVFFVQPAINGAYEIVFGDGIVGRKPKNGSVILVEYRVCNGELPNGANKFFTAGKIDQEANIQITTVTSANNGSVAETLDSIKYNAPRAFTTQERAVTAEDYQNLLLLNYPEISTVIAYGGEDVDPPQYGKVFVSVDLKDIDGLPKVKEDEYKLFLKSRSSVSLDPIFVSPDYTYVHVNSTIKYNINTTGRNPEDIRTLCTQAILNYSQQNLNKFGRTLRYSRLVNTIDSAEQSIISNETNVELIKYITPQLDVSQNLTIDFKVPLAIDVPLLGEEHPIQDIHAISSTPFTYNNQPGCILEDNGDGIVRIVYSIGINHRTIVNCGTVDYDLGVVRINNLVINKFVGNTLKVYATARTKDIESNQNVILNILDPDIEITIEQIRE